MKPTRGREEVRDTSRFINDNERPSQNNNLAYAPQEKIYDPTTQIL